MLAVVGHAFMGTTFITISIVARQFYAFTSLPLSTGNLTTVAMSPR
jgi:hypothetical protein